MNEARITEPVDEAAAMEVLNRSVDALGDGELTELVNNLESFRQRLAQVANDKTRDINKACGYPDSVDQLTVENKYRDTYETDPIAARLVNIFPDECWQSFPEVYEEEKVDDTGEGGEEETDDDTLDGDEDGADDELDADEDDGSYEDASTDPFADEDKPKKKGKKARNAKKQDDEDIDPDEELDDLDEDGEDESPEDEIGDLEKQVSAKPKPKAIVKSKGTPFEERLKQVGQNLIGPGYYDPELINPLFSWLWRADRTCGVGRYGGILLGVNDIGPQDTLMTPLKLANVPGQPPIDIDPAIYSQGKTDDPSSGPDLMNWTGDDGGLYLIRNADETKSKRELIYLRVLDEADLKITGWESNPGSPRYMRPTSYQMVLRTPQTLAVPTQVMPQIHWTRIVHVADCLYTDEVLGFPRMQQGYRRIYDLQKLYGGSAEMYWQGAFPGIMFQNLPQLAGRVEPPTAAEITGMKKQLKDYFAQLKRYMHLGNMEANMLAPAVADPSNQIMVQIEAICILYGIPKRIFMGSERGELSSSQDMRKWLGVVKSRQDRWITPFLIVPFINRLILAGILPVPKQFYVKWPDLGSLTDLEKAQVASMKMQACSSYTMGVMQILSEQDFWVRFMDMTEEEAQRIIDNAVEQASDQMMQGMQQGMPGGPMGGQFGGDDQEQFGGDETGNEPSFGQ